MLHFQGQVGGVFEQPGLVAGVPVPGRGVGTRGSVRSLPIQAILRFYGSMIPCPKILNSSVRYLNISEGLLVSFWKTVLLLLKFNPKTTDLNNCSLAPPY